MGFVVVQNFNGDSALKYEIYVLNYFAALKDYLSTV